MQDKSNELWSRLKIKYIQEMGKHLAILRDKLPTVAQEPENQDAIEALFMSAHTIRGSLGMMGMIDPPSNALDAVAIEIERTALALRKGEITLAPDVIAHFYKNIEQLELSLAA